MPKDAIQLLKDDHDKVRALLDKLSETTHRAEKTRPRLLEQIQKELEAHTTIEEEIFYPAFKEAAENEEQAELIYEAYEEHRAAEKLVLPDLQATAPDTVQFGGRAKVLKDLIEHHVDEEEDELFPVARELLGAEKLKELGLRMAARKKELLGEG